MSGKKAHRVLLGFEVGTGEPVEIPLHHTIVTGTTQLSGKTTTLEGLITRSGLKAVAFRTKRGESGFAAAEVHAHAPYFRERADWQYVQSLLEATMRERLKFERSWIIRAAKGARTLRDVYDNVSTELEKSRGLAESVYTNLKAYLEIVLPELEAVKFATSLDLKAGLNVIDLVGLRQEVQALVIASTLEAIHADERGTISVVPEAWKFLPEGRNTPVRVVIESLAREGAAIGNYVWLDSQDITGVDKGVLKNFDVWILGRQREMNEVERALKQIPLPARARPKPEDVATLPVGHFIACYGDEVRRVYVQPAWLPTEAAQRVAKTGRVDAAGLYKPEQPQQEPEPMHDAERAKLEKRLADLEASNKRLEEDNRRLRHPPGDGYREVATVSKAPLPPPPLRGAGKKANVGPIDVDLVEREVRIEVSTEPRSFTSSSVRGKAIIVLIEDLKNAPSTEGEIADAMRERGWNYGHSTMAPELAKAVRDGDLVKDDGRPARYRLPGNLRVVVNGRAK